MSQKRLVARKTFHFCGRRARDWCRGSFASAALTAICAIAAAQGGASERRSVDSLAVDESAIRIELRTDHAAVSLPFSSPAQRSISVDLALELRAPDDQIEARLTMRSEVRAGDESVSAKLDFRHADLRDRSRLPFYRLRYRLGTPDSEASGIVSLSETTPALFDLHISAPLYVTPGVAFHVRAACIHPVSEEPIPEVRLRAELRSARGVSERAAGECDANGYAVFEFPLSRDLRTGEALDLEIEGRRHGFALVVTAHAVVDPRLKVQIHTDKAIYRPGQLLHARAHVFDAADRALARASGKLAVVDPEGRVVHEKEVVTSRFGVATAEWQIPEETRLGPFRLEFELDASEFPHARLFEVSRYELPRFSVEAAADRKFYLPGQNARVEIHAERLFGQPVAGGAVRVVRQFHREWTHREQRWETEEGETYEGLLDETGRLTVELDLAREHGRLAEREHQRFLDLDFAAFVTEPLTGVTEQRRFFIRITLLPIHIYYIGSGRSRSGDPLEFYLSASYADGTPASCDIEIAWKEEDSGGASNASTHAKATRLAVVRTNSYGVAKVEGLRLPEGESTSRGRIWFVATDGDGRSGEAGRTIRLSHADSIQLRTDRSVYRPGEPVQVEVRSSSADAVVIVYWLKNGTLLGSQRLELSDGRAEFTARQPGVEGMISFLGTLWEPGHSMSSAISDERSVWFQSSRTLNFRLEIDREVYRPGEEARISFSAGGEVPEPPEVVIGVAVVDVAEEELVRTRSEFGGLWLSSGGFTSPPQFATIGGIDLDQMDALELPLSQDLQLVAEVLLEFHGAASPFSLDQSQFSRSASHVFHRKVETDLQPVRKALDRVYERAGRYPRDASQLRSILSGEEVELDVFRDPWDSAFAPRFFVSSQYDVMELVSPGPDKRLGTEDDFVSLRVSRQYFRPIGETVQMALRERLHRTGDFIRDFPALREELLSYEIDLLQVRDPWGSPYRFDFGADQSRFTIEIHSDGPGPADRSDDRTEPRPFRVWQAEIDYFSGQRARIASALQDYADEAGGFPKDDEEFWRALSQADVPVEALRDAWAGLPYPVFKAERRYSDRITIRNFAVYQEAPHMRTEIEPVAQELEYVLLRSPGPDGREGTADDFTLATFARIAGELHPDREEAAPVPAGSVFQDDAGSIAGAVIDAVGSVIPGCRIQVRRHDGEVTVETMSDESGRYRLEDLPVGFYEVRFELAGFRTSVFTDVPVLVSEVTALDVLLEIGDIREMVMLAAEVAPIQTSFAEITGEGVTEGFSSPTAASGISTPRLRQHFPETLLWAPELETDASGRAELRFPMADSITSWRVSAIASTRDGRVRTAAAQIQTFLPFFIEFDPPPLLTEGDVIELPLVLRNFLDRDQPVRWNAEPQPGLSLMGAAKGIAEVPAREAIRVPVSIRAAQVEGEAKLRLTALGSEASDAIEKALAVRPKGRKIVRSESSLFQDSATLRLEIPEGANPRHATAELRVYPDLIDHLIDGMDAVRARPYGCAEQVISATYPSLLLLRYAPANARVGSEARRMARTTLENGLKQLFDYHRPLGGVSYWPGGEPDLALSAYALRLLEESSKTVRLEEAASASLRSWLFSRQKPDGSWDEESNRHVPSPRRRALLTTASVSRALAESARSVEEHIGVARALEFLDAPVGEFDEPYLIASYAHAAVSVGDFDRAARALRRLETLAHPAGGARYWRLETNTPFYGWGLSGRIETTALAVEAMVRGAQVGVSTEQTDELIERGLLFLLHHKDRHGGWQSTQSTVNALRALLSVLSREDSRGSDRFKGPRRFDVSVDGRIVDTLTPARFQRTAGPRTVDLSDYSLPGVSSVEVVGRGTGFAVVQLVWSYYVDWEAQAFPASPSLRYSVEFSVSEASAGSEIECQLKAERIGFHGYGMMLAEIGLPPGAEVDRESLEAARRESDGVFSRYEIMPDRVIAYLWPRRSEVSFRFLFRPRHSMIALSTPSILYDYYNPEAEVVLPPTLFSIGSPAEGEGAAPAFRRLR